MKLREMIAEERLVFHVPNSSVSNTNMCRVFLSNHLSIYRQFWWFVQCPFSTEAEVFSVIGLKDSGVADAQLY